MVEHPAYIGMAGGSSPSGRIMSILNKIAEYEKPLKTLSLLLGILVVLIGFVTWVVRSLDRFEIKGEYTNITLPKDIRYFSPSSFSHFDTASTTLWYLTQMSSLLNISLENNFRDTLEDVYIKLPTKGLYSIDGGNTTEPFTARINLGDIESEDWKNILIFASDEVYSASDVYLSERSIKVGYKGGGVRTVPFTHKAYGFWKFLVSYQWVIFTFMLNLILWVTIAVIADKYEKKKKAKESA